MDKIIIVSTHPYLLNRHSKIVYLYITSREYPDLLQLPVVQRIAAKHSRTPAQILLRHTLQRGVAVIPKSTDPNRIKQVRLTLPTNTVVTDTRTRSSTYHFRIRFFHPLRLCRCLYSYATAVK